MPDGWLIDDQRSNSHISKEDFELTWRPTIDKKYFAMLPALLLIASACGGTTATGGTTFKGTKKVGLSTSLTGSVASYGQAGLNGITMAIDEVNAKGGVNGYKIELDQADDAAKAALGTENARRLIVEDKVVSLFGAVSSAVCLAESPIAKQYTVPFITFTCNDFNLTTTKFQPYIASVVPNTYMEGRAIANYLGAQSKYKTYYIIAPDYSFGHTEADAFKARLKEINPSAKIVGEDYPKLGATDYTSYINKILGVTPLPDIVYSNIYSGDLVTFVKQATPFDFFNKVSFSTLTSTDDLQTLGNDFPKNLLGYARAPFYAIDTPENKDFIQRFKARFLKDPSEWAIMGYDAFNLWANAANKAGDFGADKVMAKIVGQPFKGLRGTFTIRAIDHQANVPEWVGVTAANAAYPFPTFATATLIPGDSLLMPEDQVKKLQGG
jgi:branched-chain amino acid transport system substrate-binding protein